MKHLLMTAAALVFSTGMALADNQPIVIDPISGKDLPISEIDMSALTDEQRADVVAQLQALAEAELAGERHRYMHKHQYKGKASEPRGRADAGAGNGRG